MRALFLTIGLVCVAVSASADTDVYTCKLNPSAHDTWVPSQLRVSHDTESGKVSVMDNVIQHFGLDPVEGSVLTENTKRVSFRWTLKMVKNADNQIAPKFLYTASYFKATGKVQVTAVPAGYSNQFIAQGSCVVK